MPNRNPNKSFSNASALTASLAGLLLTAASTVPARAADITFSFENEAGDVPGTVTGLIEGIQPNGTGAASDVIIETAPSGLPNNTGETLPIDTKAEGWIDQDDSFKTSGGVVTAANLDLYSPSVDGVLYLDFSNFNELTLDGGNDAVQNVAGLSGVTYGSIAVPEPASLGIFGLAGCALLGRRRSRLAIPR